MAPKQLKLKKGENHSIVLGRKSMNLELDSFINSNMHNVITDLQQLIRQPSVSARHEGLEECAHLVCDIMSRAGITAEVLYLRKPPPITNES